MRKFLLALALLLAIIFVIGRFAEMQNVLATLEHGNAAFIFLAIAVEGAWLANVGIMFRAIYAILGLEVSLWHMVRLAAAANFFNVVAPSAGMSGIVVFIADARRNGYSSARATIAGALYVLFDYAGFLCVLAIGLFILFEHNNLNWPEIIASIILLVVACALATLLYLGMHSADELGAVLAWGARLVNGLLRLFIHKDFLSVERAHSFARDGSEGIQLARQNPRDLLLPFSLALSSKALQVSILFLMFMAFRTPFSVDTLVAGYSMGYLFLIVSPTPQGIGVVEGAMTLYLHSFGVPLEAAAVIVLSYRGVTFWVPFLFGMVHFRHLARAQQVSKEAI